MAGKKILLVEGIDDVHVLKHLCGNRGVARLDEIKDHGGIDKLLQSIPVRLKASEEGDIVGIVIDADMDVATRWRSLRTHFAHLGYQGVAEDPDPAGTVLEAPAEKLLPRVGIWIMPDNRAKGILEDFLLFMVPKNSELLARVRASVASIPDEERRFSAVDEQKVIIHTWLAWQEEPGKPLGTAITARFLDPYVAEVDVLIAWLRRLYGR